VPASASSTKLNPIAPTLQVINVFNAPKGLVFTGKARTQGNHNSLQSGIDHYCSDP